MTEDFTSSQGTLPNETQLNTTQLQSNQSNSAKSSQGRWTKEEHERFIEGMRHFGKNWRKVEQFIGTRSGAQIRSHAQKHFNRITKQGGNSELDVYEDFHKISQRKPQTEENMREQESKNITPSSECLQPYQQFRMNEQTDQITQQKQQQQSETKKSQQNEQLTVQSQETQLLHSITTPRVEINMQKDMISTHKTSSETTTKKRDWSKILSEQEKLKEMSQKTASLKETKIAEKQEAKEFKANTISASLHDSFQLKQNTYVNPANHNLNLSQLSPSDFIDQALLATIFEPADIQKHLLSFYKAQADLERLVQSVERTSNDNKISKKKRKICIPTTDELTQSLNNSCNSATTFSPEDMLSYHFTPATHRAQTLKPSPLKQSTLNHQTNVMENLSSIKSTVPQSPQISDQQLIQLFQQFMGFGFEPSQQATQFSQHSYLSQVQAPNNPSNYLDSLHHDDAWCNTLISAITQEFNSPN